MQALRAKNVLTCQRVLRAHVSMCFACSLAPCSLACQRALSAYLLTCQRGLQAQVLMCQHALNPLPHLSTSFASSVSSFDANFFSFIAIVEDLHTVGKV